MEPRLVDLDPRALSPLNLELVGSLGEVLAGRGFIEATDTARGWRRLQVVRYFCDSAYARLVRLILSTPSGGEHRWTPRSGNDELYLERLIPEGEPFTIRIERASGVAVAALPNPFPAVDVRFEAIG